MTRQARDKRRLTEKRTVADSTHFQIELGRMEAEHLSLVAGTREAAEAFDAALAPSGEALHEAGLALRAVCAHVTEAGRAIVDRCLRHAGAGAIMPGNPLERLQRDMTVAAQHYMIGDSAYEALAEQRLEIAP